MRKLSVKKCNCFLSRSAMCLILSMFCALLLSGCGRKVNNPEFEKILDKVELSSEDIVRDGDNLVYFAGFDEFGNIDVLEIAHDGDLIISMYESIYFLPENYSEETYQGMEEFAKNMKNSLEDEEHLVITYEELENCFRVSCDMKHLDWEEDVEILRDLKMLILEPGEDGLLSLDESKKFLRENNYIEN